MSPSLYRTAFALAAILLFLAIFQMPWGFYQALRLLIPAAGVLTIVRALAIKSHAWIVLGVLAIVFFFPLFGVFLDKQTWALFDGAFGVAFIMASSRLGKK